MLKAYPPTLGTWKTGRLSEGVDKIITKGTLDGSIVKSVLKIWYTEELAGM